MQIALNLTGVHELGGGFDTLMAAARLADERGIDQVTIADHLGMNADAYAAKLTTGSNFPFAIDFAYYEPVATLSAIAAVTQRLRLSMNVLVAPLRPAILLAKQLATLDVISKGRLDAAFGVGWQEAEYTASNIPFQGRYTDLEEQIEVCRALWGGAPASHSGRRVTFKDFYSLPLPAQAGGIPVWIGLPASERNVERIGRLGNAWCPVPVAPDVLAAGVKAIKESMRRHGRDPATLQVRGCIIPVKRSDGSVDLDASLAQIPALEKAGATIVHLYLYYYCKRWDDLGTIVEKLLKYK